ncbi:unnamed protein product [Mytilus edulis]|uniref:C1q domain-containing protein n=1 Tax=Mytilus edulis TaxID=6550 RepID=A0A8S3QIB2_MYTED|nr:unnamed protein product [Mytilus edulis]
MTKIQTLKQQINKHKPDIQFIEHGLNILRKIIMKKQFGKSRSNENYPTNPEKVHGTDNGIDRRKVNAEEERFLKLEKKVDIQNSRLSDLESTIHEQDMSIKRLNERLKYMETKLRKNKLKCQNSDSWISKALGYNRRRAVQQNKASVKNENHRVEQTEPVIRNKNYVNTNSKEVVTRGLDKMVAFYAFQSRDVIKPGIHQILVFDVVKTNSENGYNRFSGMFTCSTSGLYVFTSSLAMDGFGAFASFEIVKNADVEGVFFVDAAGF